MATLTELTPDAFAAPALNDVMDCELETRENVSCMDEMECESADGDVDAAVPCSQGAHALVAGQVERNEQGARWAKGCSITLECSRSTRRD